MHTLPRVPSFHFFLGSKKTRITTPRFWTLLSFTISLNPKTKWNKFLCLETLLTLTTGFNFETPFHLGTGLRRGLLDRSVCRDANDYLYIPGSTLKGVLREKCEQLARIFELPVVSPHNELGSN